MPKFNYKLVNANLIDEGDAIDWNMCMSEWADAYLNDIYSQFYSIDLYENSNISIMLPETREGVVIYGDKYFTFLGTDSFLKHISEFTRLDTSDVTTPKFEFDFMEEDEKFCISLDCQDLLIENLIRYIDLSITIVRIYTITNQIENLADIVDDIEKLKYIPIYNHSKFGILLDTKLNNIWFVLDGLVIFFGRKSDRIPAKLKQALLAEVAETVEW
jgi:hypothetical protein